MAALWVRLLPRAPRPSARGSCQSAVQLSCLGGAGSLRGAGFAVLVPPPLQGKCVDGSCRVHSGLWRVFLGCSGHPFLLGGEQCVFEVCCFHRHFLCRLMLTCDWKRGAVQ